MSVHNLNRVFQPQSIAVVGASEMANSYICDWQTRQKKKGSAPDQRNGFRMTLTVVIPEKNRENHKYVIGSYF